MDVIEAPFRSAVDRRSASDRAHIGDIVGAIGTVASHDVGPRRSLRRRLVTLAAVMGPGLIVMAGDNDAGGLSVYAQAGQNHGLRLAWMLVLLAPVLVVNQEMAVRLGAVTGAGHARLIVERFGRSWGTFALGDLLVVNLLTIVTEFIGVTLALGYFGVSRFVAVPIAAAALVAVTSSGSFRRWERAMYVLIATNVLMVPLVLLAHSHGGAGSGLGAGLVPNFPGGDESLLLVVALIGTIAVSSGLGDTALHGRFADAGAVATGLSHTLRAAGDLFAIVLLNAAIIGAAAVTLASSYAFGDVFRRPHSLHHGIGQAKLFHGSYAVMVVVAAGIVLIPGAPLGTITTAVQALAGVLLPSATVFLLLLCNDRAVLGPWTNPGWLNALASVIVGVLVVLSAILTVTTLFPRIDVATTTGVLFGALALALAVAAVYVARGRRTAPVALDLPAGARRPRDPARSPAVRERWTMPPLELLERPTWSRTRTIGMYALRGYLAVAVLMLIVKAVEIGLGH
jgi:Mn2+/Fe2+ NRAMP family transporter